MTVTEEGARLSTAPAAVAPLVPGARRRPLAPITRAWRQLTSMRTALLLLFLLALASVPGGFLPQRSLNPVALQEYEQRHPTLAPLLDRFYLFDVFASPWFAAVYLLLFISLIGCLGPRILLHARALGTPPPPVPANLSRLPVSQRWESALDATTVEAALARSLRRGRWRVRQRPGGGISAEKGYLRETGNLVFHVSLVVLLVGIAVGALFGFKGTVLVKEGDGFANAVFNFDDITPGRRFDADALVPLNFTLRDFRATYRDSGEALTFDADLTWAPDPQAPERPYTLRVNHPLAQGAAKVYLIGHGYAPKVVVRDASNAVVLDQAVPCLPQDPRFLSSCVIKVPEAKPQQLAFEGVFTPTTVQDPATGQIGSVHPAPADPVLTVEGYRGDLKLDAGIPRSIYSLDTADLEPVTGPPQALRPGQSWRLPGGGSITFEGTQEWATFQVTQDPGKLIVLGASIGMIGGLLLSLFVRRRRCWIRVTEAAPGGPHPDGPAVDGSAGGAGTSRRTVVDVGGLARTDAEAFRTEFDDLTARLRLASTLASTPREQ